MTLAAPSATPVAGWRDEDEALLERLEDAELAVELWARQAPKGASPLPDRAAGLVSELRKLPGAREAFEKASKGDLAALFPLLLVEGYATQAPLLVHHLAIYFDRLAAAIAEAAEKSLAASQPPSPSFREELAFAKVRSVAAFIALRDERAHLAACARRVVGSQLGAPEIDAAVTTIAEACLEELGRTARSGARKLEANAAVALAVLGRVDEACRIAGSDAKSRTRTVRRAESIRGLSIDEALVPILDGLAEAKLRDDGERLYPALFTSVRHAWEWSGGDEAVERFAVDEVTNLAWSIYRTSRWDALRTLLEPCFPLYDNLAQRIERDPKRHLAYAAKCAQIFVFRSECETDKSREWAYAERALGLCSTHRNGRLVMAHLCCDAAVRRLSVSFFPPSAEVERAKKEIARAEELFPQSKRLPEAKAKLKEIIERAGGVYVP